MAIHLNGGVVAVVAGAGVAATGVEFSVNVLLPGWINVASVVLLIAHSFFGILYFFRHCGLRCPFLPHQ
jgi:hypothetical protein